MSETSGPKVFVGNLSFSTTDASLASMFESAGKVKGANIIVRGRRSLGYGFVEFETEADAINAVEKFNKKEIEGRPVNVELAKPKQERPVEERRNTGGRQGGGGGGGGGGNYGRRNFNNSNYNDDYGRRPPPRRYRNEEDFDYNQGGSRYRNPGGGNRYRDVRYQEDRYIEGSGRYRDGGRQAPRYPIEQSYPRDYGYNQGGYERGGYQNNYGGYPAYGSYGRNFDNRGPPRTNIRRKRIKPVRDEERPPSKTTLFVANLPFSVNDEELLKLSEKLNAKAAHVVKTPSGRSRGYGFIEFEKEEDQLKAKDSLDNAEIDGLKGARRISVKIALQEPPKKESIEETDKGKEKKTTTA